MKIVQQSVLPCEARVLHSGTRPFPKSPGPFRNPQPIIRLKQPLDSSFDPAPGYAMRKCRIRARIQLTRPLPAVG